MRASSLLIATAALFLVSSAASAQQVAGGGGWSPGAGAAGDNTYQGFVDQPQPGTVVPAGAPFHVSGWIVDMSAEGWAGIDSVQILQGDRVIAQGSAGGSRPDVASVTGNGFWAASGFDALVPGNALSGGSVTLTVAAHTPGKGSWSRQVSISVSGSSASGPQTGLVLQVLQPADKSTVLGNKNGTIYGVAYDTRTRAELGTGVDRIQVYLDGERGLAGSQFLGESVPNGSPNWSVNWEPTRYNRVTHHFLWVYGRSNVTGEEKLVQVEINISTD